VEMTISTPQKGRLETIKVSINELNSTWFDDCLLVKENNYPVLVYGVTRTETDNTLQKVKVRKEAMFE